MEEGSLYPALQRLELNRWIEGEWGLSANNRRARFYKLTSDGRKHLTDESARYRQVTGAVARIMGFARRTVMKAIFSWKHYQRRLRYWLNHRNRQRLLREEMEFHVDSMAQDLAAQGMS